MEAELMAVGPSGHALALHLLGNRAEAEDAVQDALHSVLRTRSFDGERGDFRAWFLTIVRNRCFDLLRRRKPQSDIDDVELADSTPDAIDPASIVERDEQIAQLRRELARMSPAAREILVLRDYLGLSYADIGQILTLPKGTVMSRLHRARLDLAARLTRTT